MSYLSDLTGIVRDCNYPCQDPQAVQSSDSSFKNILSSMMEPINQQEKLLSELKQNPEFNNLYHRVRQVYKYEPSFFASNKSFSSYTAGYHETSFDDNGTPIRTTITYSTKVNLALQKRIIIFELANSLFCKEFNQLEEKAKKGLIDRDSYAKQIETIEYNAKCISDPVEKAIDPLNEAGLDPDLIKNLSHYLQEVEKTGHMESYRQHFDKIALPQQQRSQIDKSGNEILIDACMLGTAAVIMYLCGRSLYQSMGHKK